MNGITENKNVLDGTTALIETTKASGKSRGTGFMFGMMLEPDFAAPLLVTNKHVLDGAKEVTIKLSLSSPSDSTKKIGIAEYTLKAGLKHIVFEHPDRDIDLAAINIAALLQNLLDVGYGGYGTMFAESDLPTADHLDTLGLAPEVLMIGYPIGLCDERNNLPIIRQGTLASDPRIDFDGKRHFLIDCACFPGSSGSPVVLKKSLFTSDNNGFVTLGQRPSRLLGVLYAGPTHTSKGAIVINNIPGTADDFTEFRQMINLGYVIPAHHILAFKEMMTTRPIGAPIDFHRKITML